MVEIIQSGHYVTNVENFEDRIFQKIICSTPEYNPTTVMLGSSRTLMISSDLIGEKRFFNHSVTGASLYDLIAIYQLIKNTNRKITRVYIGIDPWIFNEKYNSKRWLVLSKYYYQSSGHKIPVLSEFLTQCCDLFSFSYFQASIFKIPGKMLGKETPKMTGQKFNLKGTKLPDGTLIYGASYIESTSDQIEKRVKDFLVNNVYGMESYNRVSDKMFNEFKSMVEDMCARKIEVIFILVPYHPEIWTKISQTKPVVNEVEKLVMTLANQFGVKIYGSYNPNKLNLSSSYFYDGMHCKESGIKKFLYSK
jgi:hypothetical protein